MSSEQDNNINYQTLTGAWCECESKLKDQQPQHDNQFEYPVPQVDTEITLNLSGNEVCDIENFIPDYQVSSLPYGSVSRLNEEATLTSAHIKSCQQLNASGLSLNEDENDLLPVTASDVGHSSNSDSACNPSDTEVKLRTPEPPLILDDSGELTKVASDESCNEEAKTNKNTDKNKETTKSNFTSMGCEEFLILPASSSDKKAAVEKIDDSGDEKMVIAPQSPELHFKDSNNEESTKDKVDAQLNAKLKNLKVQSCSNESDEKMITLVAQVIDSGPQLDNLTASVSLCTPSDTRKDLKSNVIDKESFALQPSNNKAKVNQPISLDMLTIVNEAAPKSQMNSPTINDALQKQGIALSSTGVINKSGDKMTPIAQLANQKRVVIKQEFVDVARSSPIVHIKSSIPTGSMTKISNLKAIPFMKPVYKFDKVSIKTLSGSTSVASPKPGLLRPGATVHRLNLTGALQKPSQLQSNSNSKLAGTATLEKPKSIFSFLKSSDQRHAGGAEKFKTIGNRIVVPVDIRKRSTSSLLNKPVVVTIKKPLTSTPSSSATNPTKFSMASGSVMHRLSSFSNNVKGTSNSNPPSVIKRLSHISNMNKNKMPLRQPMRTLQTHKSPSYNNNLPFIRQYKAVGTKIVSLSSTPSSPDSSPSRFPAFGSGGASFLRKTNWIKREIKQEENNSYGKSYNGTGTGSALHQPQDVFDELTNLDWLIKDDDRSLFREIRKLNPDDPGIGMSGDESDDNSASAARRNNKHIFTAYSKVYGPNYYGHSRAPTDYEYDPNSKPPYSFSSLIFMAVEDSDEKKLPVKEIYLWVCRHFPYYRTAPSGWKNSIRHNLSLNRCFMKAPIPNREKESAKGALWCIDPAYRTNLVQALKRSPYYPYLHPAGFKASEPLRNLADLLPGVKREQEESAAKAKQESDPARLWADPQMASAALELMRLKNCGHLSFPPGMDSSSIPSAMTAAAKQETSYYRNYSGGGERTTSSESSVEGERLVITKPNQEHTYSSPTAGSSGKKGQHLVKKKNSSPASSSVAAKKKHQERRSASPASGGSEKSGPDAAYEFEVGDFIDEINMMEVGNEVEVVSNASSSSSSGEEADDDDNDVSCSSSEEDDDQALFDSGFSSLKQYRNAQHEPLPPSSRRRTPKKTRRRRRSFSPTSPRHHANNNNKRRNSKVSSDKAPSATSKQRSSGRRSKKLPPSLEQPARRKLSYGGSRSVGRPRKHEAVATTSKKRKTDASLLSAKRSRSSTKEVNVARGKVGRPRGSKTRKLLMSSVKARLNLPASTDGEKNDRVAPPPKLRSSVSSHYHTRSSGHKLLPQSSSETRKRRSKKASESSHHNHHHHHHHRENETDEDHLSDEHMLAKADEQILAAANCLMSFATNFDMSRSTSSVDTQNTQ